MDNRTRLAIELMNARIDNVIENLEACREAIDGIKMLGEMLAIVEKINDRKS